MSARPSTLVLHAERREEKQEGGRSEFHYGAFTRRVPLPAGAKEETISATYTDGILEIAVELGAEGPAEKKIPIASAKKK